MTKLGGGIAVAVTGLVLILGKFQKPSLDADNVRGLEVFTTELQQGVYKNIYVQEPGTLTWIYALVTLIPAISCLLSIFPILKYELTGEKMKQVNAELAERRALAEAGEATTLVADAPTAE